MQQQHTEGCQPGAPVPHQQLLKNGRKVAEDLERSPSPDQAENLPTYSLKKWARARRVDDLYGTSVQTNAQEQDLIQQQARSEVRCSRCAHLQAEVTQLQAREALLEERIQDILHQGGPKTQFARSACDSRRTSCRWRT